MSEAQHIIDMSQYHEDGIAYIEASDYVKVEVDRKNKEALYYYEDGSIILVEDGKDAYEIRGSN